MASRETRQKAFIRICRDSGFRMEMQKAAALAARVCGTSPLEIWCAFPSFSVMEQIAAGRHPTTRKETPDADT